jgi:hypothetical protein
MHSSTQALPNLPKRPTAVSDPTHPTHSSPAPPPCSSSRSPSSAPVGLRSAAFPNSAPPRPSPTAPAYLPRTSSSQLNSSASVAADLLLLICGPRAGCRAGRVLALGRLSEPSGERRPEGALTVGYLGLTCQIRSCGGVLASYGCWCRHEMDSGRS